MKLLIIDDDKVCTFITTWVAKDSGIFKEIQSVQNGRDALEIFEQVSSGTVATPDLILLDLNMPLMSGFDLIEHVNELTFPERKRLPIVVLTSSENPIDIERARSLGIEEYISKSLNLKDLQSRLFSLYRDRDRSSKYFRDNVVNNRASQISN